jgi:hypothetical protein
MRGWVLAVGILILIIGIVMVIVGISIHESNAINNVPQPWYVWFLIVGGIIVAIIGALVLALSPGGGKKAMPPPCPQPCAVPLKPGCGVPMPMPPPPHVVYQQVPGATTTIAVPTQMPIPAATTATTTQYTSYAPGDFGIPTSYPLPPGQQVTIASPGVTTVQL